MIERIKTALQKAGLPDLPTDPNSSLEDCGFDSLIAVLSIAQLEQEFGIRLALGKITPADLYSLASIQNLLERQK